MARVDPSAAWGSNINTYCIVLLYIHVYIYIYIEREREIDIYIYIYTHTYIYYIYNTIVCHGFCKGVFRIRLRHRLRRSFRGHGDGVRFVGSVGSCHLSMNHRVNVSENLSHPRYNLSWFDQSCNESLMY